MDGLGIPRGYLVRAGTNGKGNNTYSEVGPRETMGWNGMEWRRANAE